MLSMLALTGHRLPEVEGPFNAVSAGPGFACGLREDHTIECWTSYYSTAPTPASVQWITQPQPTTTRPDHTQPSNTRSDETQPDDIQTDHAYGDADTSLSESGDTTAGDTTQSAEVTTDAVRTLPEFIAINAGGSHTCGIKIDKTAACWSPRYDYYGQADAPGGEFTDITAGESHTCAIRTDKTITCWGNYSDFVSS